MEVSEVDIIHRIEEHMSYMVSSYLTKSYEGIGMDEQALRQA
jgi:hypothetical protein